MSKEAETENIIKNEIPIIDFQCLAYELNLMRIQLNNCIDDYKTKKEMWNSQEEKCIKLIDKLRDNLEEIGFKNYKDFPTTVFYNWESYNNKVILQMIKERRRKKKIIKNEIPIIDFQCLAYELNLMRIQLNNCIDDYITSKEKMNSREEKCIELIEEVRDKLEEIGLKNHKDFPLTIFLTMISDENDPGIKKMINERHRKKKIIRNNINGNKKK